MQGVGADILGASSHAPAIAMSAVVVSFCEREQGQKSLLRSVVMIENLTTKQERGRSYVIACSSVFGPQSTVQ